jgi:CheY-like chemotaxis protein
MNHSSDSPLVFPEYSYPPRILVVDDNPSIHRDFDLVLLADAGEDAGLEADEHRLYGPESSGGIRKPLYLLDHALSGAEGVEKVRQALAEPRPYQLAFVDIRMPGMDGVETIKRIWQLDSQIQVVICTAYSDYSWTDLAQRLGPTDKLLVLKKPFDTIEVTQLASTLTEKWYLARKATLKIEQMELLVARRTQRLLEMQPGAARTILPPGPLTSKAPASSPDELALERSLPELPLILLVHDGRENPGQIAQSLGGEYRFIEAQGGDQGLQQAQEAVPDLVITDIGLSRLDGLELCRRLKSAELTSHIPVILVASSHRGDSQIKALEAGADHYLARPISSALLKARVDNLLRSRRKLLEHFNQETNPRARPLAGNPVDALFLRRTLDTVEKHLSDYEFDVDHLAQHLAVSRRQLFRKLRAVTGCTPNAFIRTLRLKRAAQLLKESQMTVTEVTYAVGFIDLKHFRSVFREQFGVLPTEYTRERPKAKG